ncbi:MAG: sulfatase-like hydrolase/transferase [Bacteroidota bacterium]
MKKWIWICCIAAVFSCKNKPNATENSTVEKLPNIVLLIGDDQGYPYFGFMGADYVYTPNMDALAESGTVFTNGYVPENHCRPSLQTLMTGTLPIDYENEVLRLLATEKNKNMPEAEGEKWERNFRFHAMKYFETLPKFLAKKGVISFQGGKWWEFNYENGGFSEGMTTGWTKEDEKDEGWFQKFMGGEGTELARATMQPVYDFIDTNVDRPFFIWYAPELPHYPFDAPDTYYNLYKDKNMTESAKRYYANCTWFDDGVGELMAYLKQKGMYNNTLFVYVNDNGWEQNPDQEFRQDSLRWHNGGDKGKLALYDQSFRTPIIFSWKDKIPAGDVKKDLIHSADITATLLDYMGIAIPEAVFGKSYKKVIEEGTPGPRTELIGNVTQIRWEGDMMGKNVEGYWLRTKDWFFNWNRTTQTQELYDMEKDPFNNHNVAAKHPDLVNTYMKKIEVWKTQKGR